MCTLIAIPSNLVSVQNGGIEKAAVGATLVVARLVSPYIGSKEAGRPQARFANPNLGGKPAGRPQGSPLRLLLLYPSSERLRNPGVLAAWRFLLNSSPSPQAPAMPL